MKKCIHKSVLRTSIGFELIMLYCMLCMIYKFSYIDLSYLVVVAVFFVLFLKYAREL